MTAPGHMTARGHAAEGAHGDPPARPGALWRTLAGLAVVLGAATAGLAALDALPAWIAGGSRDVRRVASVGEAERLLNARLFIPGFFPDTIAWPPHTVRVVAGPQASAALGFEGRDGRPLMLLVQTARPGDVPERLLPAVNALDEVPVALGGARGVLRRVVGPDGEVWQELSWRPGGRQVVLRLRGTVEQAVRMARSAREEP